jgi:hypothetical protein
LVARRGPVPWRMVWITFKLQVPAPSFIPCVWPARGGAVDVRWRVEGPRNQAQGSMHTPANARAGVRP